MSDESIELINRMIIGPLDFHGAIILVMSDKKLVRLRGVMNAHQRGDLNVCVIGSENLYSARIKAFSQVLMHEDGKLNDRKVFEIKTNKGFCSIYLRSKHKGVKFGLEVQELLTHTHKGVRKLHDFERDL